MIETLGGTRAEALKKATNKNWDQWIAVLDKAGMREKTHKEIAEWLSKNHGEQSKKGVVSSWWCQNITVGYEYHHKKRVLGQTSDTGFQIGAQKTLPASSDTVWQFLVSSKGLKTWLGNIDDFTPFDGYDYRTKEGISGQVRSIETGKKLRLSWKLPEWRSSSTVQLTLLPSGNKTAVHFHQEKLADAKQREAMKHHWQKVLENISKALK